MEEDAVVDVVAEGMQRTLEFRVLVFLSILTSIRSFNYFHRGGGGRSPMGGRGGGRCVHTQY